MNTILPNAINNNSEQEESRIQTIPCPAGDTKHPTMPCPANNILKRNRAILADEIMRLEQELARATRAKEPLEKRISIWANLTICKSLLYGLTIYSTE
jgi:hypothetical protein